MELVSSSYRKQIYVFLNVSLNIDLQFILAGTRIQYRCRTAVIKILDLKSKDVDSGLILFTHIKKLTCG